mmetsp:Transcript_34279/g.80124  ORF Transcript_34279/g.80124 Transcript_34279/m.80124 type:complete len:160 (+) Transcript_34279:137-616(+)
MFGRSSGSTSSTSSSYDRASSRHGGGGGCASSTSSAAAAEQSAHYWSWRGRSHSRHQKRRSDESRKSHQRGGSIRKEEQREIYPGRDAHQQRLAELRGRIHSNVRKMGTLVGEFTEACTEASADFALASSGLQLRDHEVSSHDCDEQWVGKDGEVVISL